MSRARFLVDECLSVELPPLAWERGFQASHVRDLGLLHSKDAQLAFVARRDDWCFVTRNARDYRGPDAAPGSEGQYAGVLIHAGLICLHGPVHGFTTRRHLEAFAAAIDLVEQRGGDTTNLRIEVTWSEVGIAYEIADFPPAV
jgi:hypothetical protein